VAWQARRPGQDRRECAAREGSRSRRMA
jgi:hypothetical protein